MGVERQKLFCDIFEISDFNKAVLDLFIRKLTSKLSSVEVLMLKSRFILLSLFFSKCHTQNRDDIYEKEVQENISILLKNSIQNLSLPFEIKHLYFRK